jgi:ribosomal protein S18 acetylase RimI-like enzyme
MSVRLAVPADADAMGRVQVESWRAAYAGLLSAESLAALDEGRSALRWRVRLEDPQNKATSYVAVDTGGAVVGYVCIGACREDRDAAAAGTPGATGELWALYAAPSVWGTGVGHALFSAARAALAARGYSSFILWVLPDNHRARRFYERQGMRFDGTAKDVIEDGVPVPHVRYLGTVFDS